MILGIYTSSLVLALEGLINHATRLTNQFPVHFDLGKTTGKYTSEIKE